MLIILHFITQKQESFHPTNFLNHKIREFLVALCLPQHLHNQPKSILNRLDLQFLLKTDDEVFIDSINLFEIAFAFLEEEAVAIINQSAKPEISRISKTRIF